MTNEERDELLIRLDERTIKMDKCLSNHLAHHFKVTLLVAGAALSGFVSLIILILKAVV